MLILILIALILILFVINMFRLPKYKQQENVVFGVPGAGKTTLCAAISKARQKQGINVFSNVPITGAYELDSKNLGLKMIKANGKVGGTVLLDEAGIEFNNRAYKSLPKHTIKWLKYHRHYETELWVFSQSHDDMDITLRRLASSYWLCKRSIFKYFIVLKPIGKRIGIDENTKQIIDEYFWKILSTKYIFSPPLWKLFNTLSREELPEMDWKKW